MLNRRCGGRACAGGFNPGCDESKRVERGREPSDSSTLAEHFRCKTPEWQHLIYTAMFDSVEVWSQLGKGTRFRVLLRQSDRGEETPGPTRQAASKRIPSLRVLLAENDPSVRRVTTRFLAAAGHEVIEVGDGEEALSRIKSEGADFDLLVLDAIMPKVNGTEVYTAFRSLSTAPVLFVSGHDFSTLNDLPHDRSRGLLSKPFGASELADAISKLVRR